MALGYKERRDAPPVMKFGTLLKEAERSYKVKFDGVVTPVVLPKSQVDFFEADAVNGQRVGHFEIPHWLARKEALL